MVMLCTQSIYSQNTSNFWSKSGNVVSQNDFIGSSNPGSLVFKTNDTERFRIIEQGDIVFSNNKLMNISHLFADSLDIGHTKRMTIDSLFVLKKFKFGTSSIQFDDDRNCIYASEDEKLFLQSFDFGTLYDDQHTILNLYSGNVGIGTEFPQMKLHIKKVVSPLTLQANLIPKRDGADTTRIYDMPEELDESIMTEERTGSMRLEVEVIEGSSSVWDIHPCASINPQASRHRLLFTNALENQTVMTLESGGYVGIGTLSPLQKLHIHNGNILITAQSGKSSSILFNNGYGGSSNWGNYGIEYIEPDIIGNNKGGLNFWRPWGNAADGLTENFVLHLANDGHVGIGTGNPEYKLDVCGTIHAQEVIVDLLGQCPDYVFEPNYKLMSLENLQEFIARYKHLPEIPSATQVEQEGINLAEMNMLLLKKIEELTLYIIILNERIVDMKNKN